MKRPVVSFLLVGTCLGAAGAFAQEHYMGGPVRAVNFSRTKPGKLGGDVKSLRTAYLVSPSEAKRQGRILDRKFPLNTPRGADGGRCCGPVS